MAVMITLLFLTPLFYYTPLVVLSSIIMTAMLGLIDYQAAIHLLKIDKFDFIVCMSAYIGVVFCSIEIGLIVAVNEGITYTPYSISYSYLATHVVHGMVCLCRWGCPCYDC